MSDALKEDVNSYLWLEFGGDPDEIDDEVTADHPFQLTEIGSYAVGRETCHVFAFREGGEDYLAVTYPSLCFYEAAGMTSRDLELQAAGSRWLAEHDPLDLNTSWLDDADVPAAVYRKARTHQLVRESLGDDRFKIEEGLFLRKPREYLALAVRPDGSSVFVSERWGVHSTGFPEASGWRRLAYAVGAQLARADLRS